jgi:predicted transcriptional regulator
MDGHAQNFSSKKIGVRLGNRLIERVDELAERSCTSRTEIIRAAVFEYLAKPANAPVQKVDPTRDVELEEVLREFRESEG